MMTIMMMMNRPCFWKASPSMLVLTSVISLKLNLQVREPDMLAYSPIAKNISLTFMAVLADVSIKRRALSSA